MKTNENPVRANNLQTLCNHMNATTKMLQALDAMAETVKKWDGKVINKRFAADFEKIAPTVTGWDGNPRAAFYISFSERFGNGHALRLVAYPHEYGREEIRFYSIEANFYGCRCNAAEVLEDIAKWAEILKKDIAKFEDWRDNYDAITAEYNAIAERLKSLDKFRAMHCYMDLPNNIRVLQSATLI